MNVTRKLVICLSRKHIAIEVIVGGSRVTETFAQLENGELLLPPLFLMTFVDEKKWKFLLKQWRSLSRRSHRAITPPISLPGCEAGFLGLLTVVCCSGIIQAFGLVL